MEEFIQGISRLELLKRGAVGAAAVGGIDALVRAEGAAAAEEALTARAAGSWSSGSVRRSRTSTSSRHSDIAGVS